MTPTLRRPARNQPLPEAEAARLLTLKGFDLYHRVWALYTSGWTLRAIGEAFDPPKSRSTIQSWVDRGREVPPNNITTAADFVQAPTLATPPTYIPVRPVSPGISPADLAEIQKLAPISRKYRAGMSPRHKAALANSDLTAICSRLYESDVSITELATAAGVTYRAMAKRLGRA